MKPKIIEQHNKQIKLEEFTRFQAVWAKIKGYPWWPAKILDIDQNQQNQYTVQFYPDKTISFLSAKDIKYYLDDEGCPEKNSTDCNDQKEWSNARQKFDLLIFEECRTRPQQQIKQIEDSIILQSIQNSLQAKQPTSPLLSKKQDQQKNQIMKNTDVKSKNQRQTDIHQAKLIKKRKLNLAVEIYSMSFPPESMKEGSTLVVPESFSLSVEEEMKKYNNFEQVKHVWVRKLQQKGFDKNIASKLAIKIWCNFIQKMNKNETEALDFINKKSQDQLKLAFCK